MQASPRVLLGVTGGIAAYKACEILRDLQKKSIDVRVVMTESACQFVGPLTFRALSGHSVGLSLFDDDNPIPHITLASWCDLFLVAPCTANVAAKIAQGIADDLLTATALAVQGPLCLAPAMNVHMYQNPATQDNLALLRSRGIQIIEAAEGYLACGEEGAGRLAENKVIVDTVLRLLDERR